MALLEKGMALQAAGRYEESAGAWREAEILMEKQDVFHAGEQALSLLFDQNILTYQPAPYEKPFLHGLLCIDYLILNDVNSARVEALKALKDLDEREKVVGPIAFARYAAALAFEAAGDMDDAEIEYRKIRQFGVELGAAEPKGVPLILFLGRSPRKVASEVVLDDEYRIVLPVFQAQSNTLTGARIVTETDTPQDAVLLTSVETLASRFSGRLFAGELLKEVLRRKAQKHLVNKVGDKVGSTTEKLLKTIFFFGGVADLRSWTSLPASVCLLRAEPSDSGVFPAVSYTGEHRHPLPREGETFAPPLEPRARVAILRAW